MPSFRGWIACSDLHRHDNRSDDGGKKADKLQHRITKSIGNVLGFCFETIQLRFCSFETVLQFLFVLEKVDTQQILLELADSYRVIVFPWIFDIDPLFDVSACFFVLPLEGENAPFRDVVLSIPAPERDCLVARSTGLCVVSIPFLLSNNLVFDYLVNGVRIGLIESSVPRYFLEERFLWGDRSVDIFGPSSYS